MRGVVFERPGEASWAEVETPSPGPGDVLVRSRFAGVCRTDIEMLHGAVPDAFLRWPVVPGHEWSGEIAAVGDQVDDLAPGDRVVCEGMIPCNRCRRCKAGQTNLCEHYDQIGFTRGGGYGELVLVPRHVVHRIPDAVSFETAVLVEPASCVLRGIERGHPVPGEAVGVVGIGTLGSLALRLLTLYSPGAVLAYGLRPEELAFAGRLGAGATVSVAECDPVHETHRLVGDGLDLVIETAGPAAAVDLATRLVRPGGRVVLLGVAGEGQQLAIPPDRFMWGDMDVVGSCSYTTSVWSRVVRLLEQGLVDLNPIVTHRFPAERFEDAFALMDRREGVVAKVLLEHATGGSL